MKPETIVQARNPLLAKALPALQRVGQRARLLAGQIGTDLIVMENEKICRIKISPGEMQAVREQSANYNADSGGLYQHMNRIVINALGAISAKHTLPGGAAG